ncbi:MAG: 8-oxo-dGTP diphosphatase [Lachnospiraceae bacterium]|nr:8-oxo-dGTP diphosphatase [Lachnospiraceae bacterium]
MRTELTTLCYIEHDGKYLMLHRDSKEKDLNKDKWIGVGGHFEDAESPEECIRREVKEETGLSLISLRYRGIITFVSGNSITEYMSLFTSDEFGGEQIPCDEGTLEWVNIDDVLRLNLWEGDRVFLRLLRERDSFFSLKLTYDDNGNLIDVMLDGYKSEL